MNKLRLKDIIKTPEVVGIGNPVDVKGWVRSRRGNNFVQFIALNDGSIVTNLQVVADTAKFDEALLKQITTGSCIHVTGTLVESQGKGQTVEVQADTIEVYGTADPEQYPLQKKGHSMEFLREIAHLRPRTNYFGCVLRLRHAMAFAIHKYFNDRGFFYLHTPLITASDAEGAGEMFNVTTFDLNNIPRTEDGAIDYKQDFFGKHTNLTVSGQLEGELGAMALGNIYTFGPTFRAENSNTPRHLAEFWMIEPEMAFCDLKGDMEVMESMVKYIISYVLENAPEEMAFFNQFVDKGLLERLDNILNSEFGHVTYTEAVDLLKKSGKEFQYPVEWGIDLQTEHERYLTEEIFKKPIFVTDYPKDIKAFYMRVNDDNKTVAACDCLVPGVGEIIGGSQREERLDVLEGRMDELGLNKDDYWWYLNLRKFGGVTHSGFGLGFERMIMYLTGVQNIRDVLPFPRTPKNAEF